ncbi:hypothetical protein GCM10023091_14160 [Ravibacter arvi]|uniref:Methyltransferase FkbM domain-containing protein n=1 Tax=Ravibacter arvi TaxID=2051041 RepID=A0ABP8LWM3_9BACT
MYYNGNYSPEGVDVSASLFSPDRIYTVDKNHHKISVSVIDFNKWFRESNISRCDVLKLDCEGAEYDIVYSIPDGYFSRIRYIVADVHKMSNENENIHALSAYLERKGYSVNTVNDEILYAKYTGRP